MSHNSQAVLWPGVHGLRRPWDDQRHHPLHHLLARTLLCIRTIRLCHRWCSGWRGNDPNWQKSSSIVSGEKCNLCQRAALKSTEPSMPGDKYIFKPRTYTPTSTDCHRPKHLQPIDPKTCPVNQTSQLISSLKRQCPKTLSLNSPQASSLADFWLIFPLMSKTSTAYQLAQFLLIDVKNLLSLSACWIIFPLI